MTEAADDRIRTGVRARRMDVPRDDAAAGVHRATEECSVTLLSLQNVIKSFAGPAGECVSVLNGVCLEVARGDSIAITGPSGSGKTTLLNLMGGLDRPDAGTIRLGGEQLSDMDEKRSARVRNREIGFVFQSHLLLPQCTALENVLVPAMVKGAGHDMAAAEERGRELLTRVGLAERMDFFPGRLSGGECQRVAVVRSLINRPSLLLADEPTGALDAVTAAELVSLLCQLNREEGPALIMVTHSSPAAPAMGRRYALRAGLLKQE